MPDVRFLTVYFFWAFFRWWALKILLKLPTLRGEGWFVDVELGVESEARKRLAKQYRNWVILATAATELLALADAVWFGKMSHLLYVQAPLVFVLAAVRRLLLRGFVLRARELAAQPPGDEARLLYSLKPRRVSDYSNGTFETINLLTALAALGVIFSVARESQFLPAFVILYLEGGVMLKKYALLQNPVALPAEGPEAHLRLAEDAFRLGLRTLDYWRGAMTLFLVVVAVKVKLWDAWMAREQAVGAVVLAFTMALAMALVARQMRGRKAILEQAKKLQGPAVGRKLRDPQNLHMGGLVYCNADNPAVAVDGGPLRFAINVVNRNTYVYAGYWVGLVALLMAIAKRM